eukprot:TRINITY_DN15511_c0_g1_i2.p1 TRINITY_DN15511_c0_g1~~TRINITY_DN15511_c0_g1_i2.p1  ORF type:complete len:194 (+),score=48.62 TRINITY_DN15511_c0_g1_i2:268-849(+)
MAEPKGLVFKQTPKIRDLLSDAIALPSLPSEIGAQLVPLLDDDSALVPYPLLRTICQSIREEEKDRAGPYLHQVLQGASPHLVSPAPRQRSKALEARLAKLRIEAEEREYAELVRDVTKKQREEAERVPFATYKEQLGLGLHVIFTMGTGYACGYYFLRALFPHDYTLHQLGGVLGIMLGMLLETLLFIIRSA